MLSKRDCEKTRSELLAAASQEIHVNGFQAASLSQILANCKVTKGALYHHFPNKKALGLAVIDEIIGLEMDAMWIKPLEMSVDPIEGLIGLMKKIQEEVDDVFIILGCPMNNLAQEMSPIDEDFRTSINVIYKRWHDAWVKLFLRGQENGTVRQDIDIEYTVTFIIASLEGCIGMAKNAQSISVLEKCSAGLLQYLESLKGSSEAPVSA